MAIQLGLSATPVYAIGVRHGGERRRGGERRSSDRGTPDRRRWNRRRARLRSALLTALTFAIPRQMKDSAAVSALIPRVSVSMDSFVGVPPGHAYDALIREAAALYGIKAALIRSVIETESAFNPLAVSPAGAVGLMQLMPDVAADFGVANPFDPRENIMAGARYLRQLLNRHHGNLALTLASYNAGPTAVARFGRVPPFPETQHYVVRVTSLLNGRQAGD